MGLVVLTSAPGAVVASDSRILKRQLFQVAQERCDAANELSNLSEQMRAQSKLTRIASRTAGQREGEARALELLADRLTRAAVAERIELEQIRPTLVQLVSNAVGSVLNAVDRRVWFDEVLRSVEQQLNQCQRIVFTVHPDSVGALREAIDTMPYTVRGTIRIVEDASLAADVCDVASDHGFATCSIQSEVSSIERAVDAMLSSIATSHQAAANQVNNGASSPDER